MSASTGKPSRTKGRTSREAGFSILELIVTFAIVSIVLAYLFEFFADGTGSLSDGGDTIRAALAADAKLAELDAAGNPIPGVEQGVTPDGLSWHIAVDTYREADQNQQSTSVDLPDLLQVTVTISRSGETAPIFTLQSLRFGHAE